MGGAVAVGGVGRTGRVGVGGAARVRGVGRAWNRGVVILWRTGRPWHLDRLRVGAGLGLGGREELQPVRVVRLLLVGDISPLVRTSLLPVGRILLLDVQLEGGGDRRGSVQERLEQEVQGVRVGGGRLGGGGVRRMRSGERG